MNGDLYTLVRRRMAAERVEPGDPVAVAELHRRLVPYHECRDHLGYATKAEYDVALLRLLADDGLVDVAEPALREAVRAEIRQPEPGLGFLHRFAASEIRLRGGEVATPAPAAGPGAPTEEPETEPADGAGPTPRAESGGCRRCGADLPARSGVRFCPACGADQVAPTCADCGAEVEEGWKYCAFCGSVQPGRDG